MNRSQAISIILTEAFSENGLAVLAHQGEDAGYQRIARVISALEFLAKDLSSEDRLDRMFVSALFLLGSQTPEDYQYAFPPTTDSRCSLYQQCLDLKMAAIELIESWENWPSLEGLEAEEILDPAESDSSSNPDDEKFEGYRVGDITYCVIYQTEIFFPVRVIRLGFNVIEVEPLSETICRDVCESFLGERLNRCFLSTNLPSFARFGGFDEFTSNAERKSGPKLWLLPYHYATTIGAAIRKRHAEDPTNWPLPTGTVFERWFK